MTDEQLRKAQSIKRTTTNLECELDKFKNVQPQGINIFLPNCGTLIEDVKQVFIKHLNEYNRKFKEL
jgi:hypothetical protein